MHQTQEGKQWYFGLKVHIDVDRKRGLVHSLTTTSANVHDLHQLLNLMHGEKSFISANSSYRGVENRKETKNRKLSWLVGWLVGYRNTEQDTSLEKAPSN
jgi:transposase, IS5 family